MEAVQNIFAKLIFRGSAPNVCEWLNVLGANN